MLNRPTRLRSLVRSHGQTFIFQNMRFKAAYLKKNSAITPELQAHLIKIGLSNKNVIQNPT